MAVARAIEAVFFDIGGTLGETDPATLAFQPYPSSAELLRALRDDLGLRVGIITTLGDRLSSAEAIGLLRKAGLYAFIDPNAFVSDHDAAAPKPHIEIYALAAARVDVPIGRCLFIGENLLEVLGARVAGMKAILKPCPPGRELT
jgi:FMN phosphatase YigB (HAD superfamily)